MSYMALYRKWRPVTFDGVKGQDHIVQTLQNQIISQRIGHAYLFCGTRGTGKTSIAKIFARAVNCEHPQNGSPCNECPTCRAILEGASLNVVEIDAASNNGVENIREIREQVQYPPTEGKYRVYIIDEVHMLSTGAFNALLKTLEEPPSYVIFILATTEVNRIPITVLSRCQRYDFKRISIPTLVDRLKELTEAEQIPVEDRALAYIAKAADRPFTGRRPEDTRPDTAARPETREREQLRQVPSWGQGLPGRPGVRLRAPDPLREAFRRPRSPRLPSRWNCPRDSWRT